MHLNLLRLRNALFGMLGFFMVACGSGGGGGSKASCTTGGLGCECYPNRTCNIGLTCTPSLLCGPLAGIDAGEGLGGSPVVPTGGVGGGLDIDGSIYQGGATGSGGLPLIDANLGVGGIGPGTGGLSSPGIDASPAGGVSSAGGRLGTGGAIPGTGGTIPGTGGVIPGTGGATPLDAGTGGGSPDAGPCSEPSLNCPCSTVGALGCVGHAQKGMMMCDGTKWVPNGACAGTLLCDPTASPTQGTCVQPVAACANQQPGYSYCGDSKTKLTCDANLLSVLGDTCLYVCASGQCTGDCVPSTLDCDGKTPISCASNAVWLRGTTCTTDCNKGACCGALAPNVCDGICVDLQTNNANCGKCGAVCGTTGGKSCRAGICQCPAGMVDCAGTCVSLATSSANCGACGNACENGRTCQAGACACPPGAAECAGTCTNVLTDGNNCGACGVTCGAATCYNGNCGGSNLIVNGDFSDGGTYWTVTQASTGVVYGTLGTSYCVSLPTYGLATLGWPGALYTSMAIPLAAGYGYTFSYTVSATSSLYSFAAKVGHAVTPYTAAYSTSLDYPAATDTQFAHSFTSTYGDTGAGVAFTMEATAATTVCFSNVSLVRH